MRNHNKRSKSHPETKERSNQKIMNNYSMVQNGTYTLCKLPASVISRINANESGENDFMDFANQKDRTSFYTVIYDSAVAVMKQADNESAYKEAASYLETIKGFKDADSLAKQCLENAENCRKNSIYSLARSQMLENTLVGYETAIKTLRTIPGWKDVDKQISTCQKIIKKIQADEEARRLDQKRKKEEERIAEQKRIEGIIVSLTLITIVCFSAAVLVKRVIIPNNKYNSAVSLYDAGKYDEAISAFQALDGYRDSESQIENCYNAKYNSAISLYNVGKYDEAITAFRAMIKYKDSESQIEKCYSALYDSAVSLYDTGKYDEAIIAFRKLDDYKDSETQLEKCYTAKNDSAYDFAIGLYNAGKYDEAITAFRSIIGYSDSVSQIKKCYSAKYDSAVSLYNVGKYDEAIAIFQTLDGHKDSEAQLEKCYIGKYGKDYYSAFKDWKIGDIYKIGKYEQDNKKNNGKEDIEWIILDKKNMSLLLISRYALDCRQFNTIDTEVTWETCSLRQWLNDSFINNAFGEEELTFIQDTPVGTAFEGNTVDRVFLLSITEVNYYFPSNNERKCLTTDYAIAQGAHISDNLIGGDGTCFWWLRSTGGSSNKAAIVTNGGGVSETRSHVNNGDYAVRPVMWINLGG